MSTHPSYRSILTAKCKKNSTCMSSGKNSTESLKIAQTCVRRLRVFFLTMLMAHFCHKFQFPPLSAAATESVILRKHFEAQSGSLPWLLSLLSPSLSPISFQPDLYLFLILAQRLQRNTLRAGMCL